MTRPFITLLTIVALLFATDSATAQFDELASKVPSNANTIFLMNVDKILASPAAAAGKWKDKVEEAYSSGVTILPPDASEAIMAADFDFESTHTHWEAALLNLDKTPSLDAIAKMTGGTVTQVEAKSIVALPGEGYVVQFGPKLVAAMSPANRQSVARWVKEAGERKTPALAPYLMEAYSYANDLGTPIVLAMDLADAVSLDHIRNALSTEATFEKDTGVAVEKAATFLASVRGVTLGITLANKPFGKVRVDFEKDIPFKPEVAKTLFLRALERRGATIEEFDEWTPKVDGKLFTLEGYMAAGGLRRIFSLFDRPPSVPKQGEQGKIEVASTNEDVIKKSTQTYFKTMNQMLDDLRDKPKTVRNYTVGSKGVWYKTYARKIQRLPVLNVDPELVAFSSQVANALYQASDAITTGSAKSRIGQLNAPSQFNYYSNTSVFGYGVGYGGYNPYGVTNWVARENVRAEAQDRTRIRSEARIESVQQANNIVDQMEQAVAGMRAKMTQKYQVEF